MTTTQELRAELAALRNRYDKIFAALTPLVQPTADGCMRWKDVDLAEWLDTNVDCVRGSIVAHVSEFLVDDACHIVLLDGRGILALLELNAPRVSELNYLLHEMSAVAEYLRDLASET